MKKILAVMLFLMILSSAAGLAGGMETDKPITFSGYEFGSTFSAVRKTTRLFCIDFLYGPHSARIVGDAFEDIVEREGVILERKIPSCFFARPSDGSRVAGYDASAKLWFVYPFQDGIWAFDEAQAIFYAGVYEFSSWEDLPAIYAELTPKLTTLYGEPFYTGGNLDEVLGEIPCGEGVMRIYENDSEKYKPEYTVWKSNANGAYAVLTFWYNTDLKEYKLKLSYISDCAEEHFAQMAKIGAFGESAAEAVSDGMEGL